MLDLRRIRTEPEAVAAALDRRGPGTSAVVEQVLALDNEQRRLAAERDDVRSQVKAVFKQVGRLRGQGAADEAEAKMARASSAEKALAADADRLTDDIRALLLATPNLPSDDGPNDAGEADNVVLRTEGYDPDAYGEHQRVPHWDIGDQLGLFDFVLALYRAALRSGDRRLAAAPTPVPCEPIACCASGPTSTCRSCRARHRAPRRQAAARRAGGVAPAQLVDARALAYDRGAHAV